MRLTVGATARRFLAAALVVAGAEAGARIFEQRVETNEVRWYDETTQLKVGQMEGRAETDVVIVGTSMAWQGLVPSSLAPQLGTDPSRIYNAGLAGAVPEVTEPWLLDVVIETLSPETVVWGVSSLDFSAAYGDANAQIYAAAPATRSGLLPAADRELREHSALIRQRSVLRDPSRLFGEESARLGERFSDAEETLGPDGARLDFDEATDEKRAAEVRQRISPYHPDRDDLAAVARTVAELRRSGIEVVFVELPVPERFRALYDDPADHERFEAVLDAMVVELDVPLLRPTEDFVDDDFVDFTHLDAAAAARLSTDVGSQLAALRS